MNKVKFLISSVLATVLLMGGSALAYDSIPSPGHLNQLITVNFGSLNACGGVFDTDWYFPDGSFGGNLCAGLFPIDLGNGLSVGMKDNGDGTWTYIDFYPTGSILGIYTYVTRDTTANCLNGTGLTDLAQIESASCFAGKRDFLITDATNFTGFTNFGDLTANITTTSGDVFLTMLPFGIVSVGITLGLMFLSWAISKLRKRK